MKNKTITSLLVVLSTLLLSSCADSAYILSADIPGFFHGIWHGMILPISFIVSLFDHDVAVYAISNSGHWYDFGFFIGCGGPISFIINRSNS